MTDNFYIDDLLLSVRKETTMERYLPLTEYRDRLLTLMHKNGVTFKNEVTPDILAKVEAACGSGIARLFARFIHIYDFNRSKLKEMPEYDADIEGLLRLPGVRMLRANLYCHSGVTLKVLAEKSTEEIQEQVRSYIEREHRSEIVPLTKEVNCHREVAKMLLHTEE